MICCYDIVCFLLIVPLPLVLEITLLKVDQFAWELQHHPNWQLCNFVLDGLRNGFKLGFQPVLSLKSAKKNKSSAYQQPLVIDEYLAHGVSRGRVAGPFRSPPLPNLHISSFGVILKKGQPGKWRLIVDLSSPGGASINHGINAHEFTLHYITVDQVICMVSRLGRGALMAKFDVEAAYRNIPVHPSDNHLPVEKKDLLLNALFLQCTVNIGIDSNLGDFASLSLKAMLVYKWSRYLHNSEGKSSRYG